MQGVTHVRGTKPGEKNGTVKLSQTVMPKKWGVRAVGRFSGRERFHSSERMCYNRVWDHLTTVCDRLLAGACFTLRNT